MRSSLVNEQTNGPTTFRMIAAQLLDGCQYPWQGGHPTAKPWDPRDACHGLLPDIRVGVDIREPSVRHRWQQKLGDVLF